jgi:hypothetical protein
LGNRVKDRALLDATVAAYRAANYNVSETARVLGLTRGGIKDRLRGAADAGLLEQVEIKSPNAPTSDSYLAARERKIQAFQKKQRKGDWRKPVMSRLPSQPFRLKVFGDPHLDADGCNFELFERHWLEMDASKGVYGVCVGDWFNNWIKALGHLWREESTHPSDAWLCLEWLMEERGDALIAACSGNHDDWTHGPVDPIDLLMKKHGVLYRKGAIRVMFDFDGCEPLHVAIRHKWRGKSMYSAGHWGASHINHEWRDPIMIGGHIHQDDPRLVRRADGTWCHVCQVSAFKEYDDFADVQGFTGTKISPVWDLVIQPARSGKDPERVKVFWDSEAAAKYLEAVR